MFALYFISHKFYKIHNDSQLDQKPVERYKSPGSIRYPVGDEELNNNLFDDVGINEAMEKHDKLSDYGLKCRDLPDITDAQVEKFNFIS